MSINGSAMKRTVVITAGAIVSVLAGAGPAGAQQIIDASGHRGGGGLAFVAFAILCLLMVGSLFYMDKVRRRASEREDQPTP